MKRFLVRKLGKWFRDVKSWFLVHQPPLLTPLYFSLLYRLNELMTSRRLTRAEELFNVLWKQAYHAHFRAHPEQRFKVRTDFPVAFHSADQLHPHGSIRDNSRNYRFNIRLYRLLGHAESIALLDLGCSGGGLVRSFLEDGHAAVGLEGSDASLNARSGEWETIPFHLFTCDIVKPFAILSGRGESALFDVVTAWEVLEHIQEGDLPQLAANIRDHLRDGGLFVCSVAFFPDGDPRVGAVYHQTLRPVDWWVSLFAGYGFEVVQDHPFQPEDMVRGHGRDFKNWHPADGAGAHLVLRKVAGATSSRTGDARSGSRT